jgi:N-ethylmaleimide reductase
MEATIATGEYGGSPENRALLLLQVLDAVLSVWSSDRIGISISPATQFYGMSDSGPQFIFNCLAAALNRYSLATHHRTPYSGNAEVKEGLQPVAAASLRELFTSRIIAAGGFVATGAEAILEKGDADLVAFGRLFIANPDLPHRFRRAFR